MRHVNHNQYLNCYNRNGSGRYGFILTPGSALFMVKRPYQPKQIMKPVLILTVLCLQSALLIGQNNPDLKADSALAKIDKEWKIINILRKPAAQPS